MKRDISIAFEHELGAGIVMVEVDGKMAIVRLNQENQAIFLSLLMGISDQLMSNEGAISIDYLTDVLLGKE